LKSSGTIKGTIVKAIPAKIVIRTEQGPSVTILVEDICEQDRLRLPAVVSKPYRDSAKLSRGILKYGPALTNQLAQALALAELGQKQAREMRKVSFKNGYEQGKLDMFRELNPQ